MKYQLSKLALEDIDAIWEYGIENWSMQQAEKYYKSIIETILSICRNPEKGRSINEVKESHRRMNIGSHMIIYKFQNNIIFVDRILHQRMDIDNQI